MEDTEKLLDKAVSEIEAMLNTKTAVGEPIVVGDNTLIPLVSVGFGFGGGGGQCGCGQDGGHGKIGDCLGSGTGAGGGVKPVALVIVNADGVRVEPIKSGSASALEKFAEVAGAVATSKSGRKLDSKQGKKSAKADA